MQSSPSPCRRLLAALLLAPAICVLAPLWLWWATRPARGGRLPDGFDYEHFT